MDELAPSRCVCPGEGYSPACPWARAFPPGAEPMGHVKACPVTHQPCPCLPGSTAHAYCASDAQSAPMTETEGSDGA